MTENITKLIIDFNKQLRRKTKPAAADIADAWKAADTTDILDKDFADYVFSFAKGNGISETAPELLQVREATTVAQAAAEKTRQKETLLEQTAALKTALESNDTEKTTAVLNELQKEAASTASSGRKRIATYEGFLDQLIKYKPENDFRPSLFFGLSCPNGTISIIGARPAGGKTSALINIMRETLDTDRAAFFVNLEMNSRQILTNLCLSIMYEEALINEKKELETIEKTIIEFNKAFKYGDRAMYETPSFARLQKIAMDKVKMAIEAKKLFIYDGIGNTLEGITADIACHVKTGDIVLFDYIQRVPAPFDHLNATRQVQIQKASNKLLETAIMSQAVIISGAQFNRDGDKEGKEAELFNFRESGDIEQDAHNAIAIENNDCHYMHVLKAREGGADFDRGQLETVKQYVHWTVTYKYEPPAKEKKAKAKKIPIEDD